MKASQEVIDGLSKVRGRIPLTRRGFLTGAAATGAAVALAGCSPSSDSGSTTDADASSTASSSAGTTYSGNSGKTMGEVLGAGWLGEEPEISDDEISETVDTYIVVCGAGQSGTAVARRAAELGAEVLVIDQQAEDSFTVLGNDFGHLNSSWQVDYVGIPEYDEVEFINEYQIYSANRAQPTLVSQFAHRSGEVFDWFIDDFTDDEKAGITPLNWPIPDGYEYFKKPYFNSYVGTANFDSGGVSMSDTVLRNQQKAKDAGAEFRYETTAVRLVHNDDGTEVTGVIAQNADGTYVQINASAVVLCCGDCGSNTEMYNALCAEDYALGEYEDLMAMSGWNGDGIAMAMRIGAKVEIGTGGDMGNQARMPLGPMEGCETMWLNKYGKRFCNEAYGGPLLSGCQVARIPGSLVYGIWGGNWQEVLLNNIAGHLALKYWDDDTIAEIEGYMDAAEAAGEEGDATSGKYLYCADTLEELCDYMGMEEGVKANALAAVETWNAASEAGVDEEFGRSADTMWLIDEGPYYGLPMSKSGLGGALVTTSGLLVTGDQQVQGQGFEPIKGLYACGNTSGGRFPLGYNGIMNGVSVGMCQTLGYVLGEFLATGDLDEATTLGSGNAEIKEVTEDSSEEEAEGGDEAE